MSNFWQKYAAFCTKIEVHSSRQILQSPELIVLMAIALWSIPAIADAQALPEKIDLKEFKVIRQNRAEALQPKLKISHDEEDKIICQADIPPKESPSTEQPRRIRRIHLKNRPCPPTPPVRRKTQSTTTGYFAPRIADNNRLNPLTTTLPLNNTFISHRTNWEVFSNPVFGENIEQDVGFGGIVKLSSQVTEGLGRDNIFTTDQIGHYLQVNRVRDRRSISTSRFATEKLLGLETQMSLIGSCLLGEEEPTEECTYTPGIVVDRNSIDPTTLAPTRIFHTSDVGDVVTPESRAIMEQDGFSGGEAGEEIGVDLYFPNVGTISREEGTSQIRREEKVDLVPLATFSRVRQVVKANDTKAVIGRTIKGTPLVFNGDRNLLGQSAAAVSFLLPDAVPKIDASQAKFNPGVNQNLFIAANNTRLPADSYTIYHAGFGSAKSITSEVKNARQIPLGQFNALWFGLSPVVDREYGSTSLYEPHDNITIIADAGGEGGADSDVQLVSIVNEDNFASNTLQNIHTQIYLKFFSHDADVYTSSSTIEKTKYQPHLSFTGNITGSRNVLRYYAGGIINDPFRGYLGLDYKYQTFNGWNFSTGGIGYLNPDREYYSQLWGNINKRIKLSPQTNITFLTGFNYALDRPDKIREVILSSRSSSVNLGSRIQWRRLSLSANYNFDSLLPNSIESRLIFNLGWAASDRLSFSAYYTPINQNTSRSLYGANTSLRLGKEYNSPSLNLGWSNTEYRFENGFVQADNIFTLVLRTGQPGNPFNPATAKELREKEAQNFEQQQQEEVGE